MGRDLVLNRIKSQTKPGIILGMIMGVLFLAFGFVLFVAEVPGLAIFVVIMALLMFLCAFICIARRNNPMRASCLKQNPRLLEQADELFSDIIYKDDFVIYSNRIIASAKDITQMAAFDQITDVSESSSSYNFITTEHVVLLTLPTYQVRINVYGKKRAVIEDLEDAIKYRCPNLMRGYKQD